MSFNVRATHGTKKLSEAEIEEVYKDRQFPDYETFKLGMRSADGSECSTCSVLIYVLSCLYVVFWA